MSVETFVTAEHSVSPRWGVWVMLYTYSVKRSDGAIVPSSYVITTSSGYRADLPACRRDECLSGDLTPCTRVINDKHTHSGMSVNTFLKHCETHCHRGWHLPTAEKLRDKVAKTYTSKS